MCHSPYCELAKLVQDLYCTEMLLKAQLLHAILLDHVFVSNALMQDIVSAELHDTDLNLSDHIPIIYTFCWLLCCNMR